MVLDKLHLNMCLVLDHIITKRTDNKYQWEQRCQDMELLIRIQPERWNIIMEARWMMERGIHIRKWWQFLNRIRIPLQNRSVVASRLPMWIWLLRQRRWRMEVLILPCLLDVVWTRSRNSCFVIYSHIFVLDHFESISDTIAFPWAHRLNFVSIHNCWLQTFFFIAHFPM